ncbi:MAG: hypothetical protein LIO94_12470 [Clostridiales bacterium]|nr:hypothetical protein [Clostridiales bacterium]
MYDTDAALYPGAIFPEAEWKDTKQADAGCGNEENHELYNENGAGWYTSELLLLDGSAGGTSQNQAYEATTGTSEERESEASTAAGSSAGLREEEARMVGRRILELAGTMPVLDKESGTFRPARYGDMVILLRSVSGWAEIFGEVLGNMGIPCFTGSQKGYFSTAEIRIVLSYLKILDNPMQDIPLAAVLRSAIGRFTDEELAGIRLAGIKEPGLSFYDCCLRYLEQSPDTQISKKLKDFFSVYEQLREKCSHTPVHLLLWELLDVTGYGEYAAALPAGWQRKANLDMLVEKAIAYEATSYRGLFHFVRYIENLQKYEVDYGEANLGSEADDTVRIMSIHKSKGLEFPIVFVSGLGKQFNESDVRSRVVMHPEWGIACDYISNTADTLPRMRQPTLLKKMIQRQLASENLGEELRVLYVAMTRAKEKLILTGSVKDLEKRKIAWKAASSRKEGTLSYSWLSGASTYLDWIVPSLTGNRDVDFPAGGGANTEDERQFEIREVHSMENAAEEAQGRTEDLLTLQELLHMDPSVCHDKEAKEYLEQVFSSAYPYEANRKIPGKITVSELKKMSQRMEEKDAQELYAPEPVIPLFPEFERLSDSFINGAARGTAYHTFMENLDFSKKEHLRFQLEELIRCGKMSEEEAATICLDEIAAFLHSEIGIRMELAAREGRLFREQPFVLGISSDEVYGNQGSSRIDERQQAEPHQSIMEPETILVQGIIDAYFFDEDRITLVDYKTDRVSSGNILVKRYRTQMDYYAKALERLTGKRLRDRIIYSFCLKKEIHL